MFKIRITNLLTVVTLAVSVARAAPAEPEQSLTLRVEQRAQHMREILDLIHSKDPATRSAALQAALQDSDHKVRDLAISGYLGGFNHLTPVVVIEKGGTIVPEDAPQITFGKVSWMPDGRSFTASDDIGCRNVSPGVQGQIAGGRVSIHFDSVCLSPQYLSKDGDSSSAASPSGLASYSCTLIFIPNDQGDELDGELHCLGVPTVAKVRLAFGD